jgi:hypothetical protein
MLLCCEWSADEFAVAASDFSLPAEQDADLVCCSSADWLAVHAMRGLSAV